MRSQKLVHHQVGMEDRRHSLASRSQAVLRFDQVQRLQKVIEGEVEIHGRGNFPTLQLPLRELLEEVVERVKSAGLEITELKINGGAASHIVASCDLPFNDIDLIFAVDLSCPEHFESVKNAVLDSLLAFLPTTTNKTKISHSAIANAYIRKLTKVDDGDRWSLLSLNNECGRFVELKFVNKMRRQFEFSVDSFQVHLDAMLAFYKQQGAARESGDLDLDDLDRDEVDSAYSTISSSETLDEAFEELQLAESPLAGAAAMVSELPTEADEDVKITPKSYPTVIVESVFGDIKQALQHLNDKLIDTWHPEEIRGGGLLKYCNLLIRGYRPAVPRRLGQMEKYMCSRFFIDFPEVHTQQKKLVAYLEAHFRGNLIAKHEYLVLLYRIVNESTICLMNHERRLTLCMIDQMANSIMAQLSYYNYAIYAAYPVSRQVPTVLYIPSRAPQCPVKSETGEQQAELR